MWSGNITFEIKFSVCSVVELNFYFPFDIQFDFQFDFHLDFYVIFNLNFHLIFCSIFASVVNNPEQVPMLIFIRVQPSQQFYLHA
jgi:hypothetical protein